MLDFPAFFPTVELPVFVRLSSRVGRSCVDPVNSSMFCFVIKRWQFLMYWPDKARVVLGMFVQKVVRFFVWPTVLPTGLFRRQLGQKLAFFRDSVTDVVKFASMTHVWKAAYLAKLRIWHILRQAWHTLRVRVWQYWFKNRQFAPPCYKGAWDPACPCNVDNTVSLSLPLSLSLSIDTHLYGHVLEETFSTYRDCTENLSYCLAFYLWAALQLTRLWQLLSQEKFARLPGS